MNSNTDRNRTSLLRPALLALVAALTLGLSVGSADARDRGNGRGQGQGQGNGRGQERSHASAHPGNGHGRAKPWKHGRRDRREYVRVGYGETYRFQSAPRYRAHRRAPVRFVVPTRIAASHAYAEYRYGRVYHNGHGHWHDVYRFPVYGSVGLTWRPYDYCGGQAYATGTFAYDGPRFSLRIGF